MLTLYDNQFGKPCWRGNSGPSTQYWLYPQCIGLQRIDIWSSDNHGHFQDQKAITCYFRQVVLSDGDDEINCFLFLSSHARKVFYYWVTILALHAIMSLHHYTFYYDCILLLWLNRFRILGTYNYFSYTFTKP